MRATAAALLLLVLAVVARGGEAREVDGLSARQLLTEKTCTDPNCHKILKHECEWLSEGKPECDYDGRTYHVKVKNCFMDKKVSYVTIKHGLKCTEYYPAHDDYLGFLELKCGDTITIYGYDKDNVKGDGSEPCKHKPGTCKTCKYDATYHCKAKAGPGKVCREAAGVCDEPEYYNHECKCPHNEYKDKYTVCRNSTDLCDAGAKCTGHDAYCPRSGYKDDHTVCRPSTGFCDPAEKCTGHSKRCPEDKFKPHGTVCRKSKGPCDVKEYCEHGKCPDDKFVRAGKVCRPKHGKCDVEDKCDGHSAECEDKVANKYTVCRKAKGPCDAEEKCDGHNKKCPDDYCVHEPTKLTDETPYCPVKKMG